MRALRSPSSSSIRNPSSATEATLSALRGRGRGAISPAESPSLASPAWHRRRRDDADEEGDMEQRVSLITLGVADLRRARTFYEGLGWSAPLDENDDVVFFPAGGMVVALWDRGKLAE